MLRQISTGFALCATLLLGSMLFSSITWASIDTYEFSTPDKAERFSSLNEELRCPKCQNQNLADSSAPIAMDLKAEVYRLVEEGKGNEEIKQFLTSRYGDFVLYKPRFSVKTLLLWGGPVLFLLIGLFAIWSNLRRTRKQDEPVGETQAVESPAAAVKLSDEEQRRLAQLLK